MANVSSTGKLGIRIRYQGYGSRKVVVLCIPNSGFLSRICLTQSVAVPSLSLFSLFLFFSFRSTAPSHSFNLLVLLYLLSLTRRTVEVSVQQNFIHIDLRYYSSLVCARPRPLASSSQ